MGGFGRLGGIGLALRPAPQPRRFAPAHRRDRPGGPALARLGPPGHSIRPRAFNHLYISRRIGLTFRPGSFRVHHASGSSPIVGTSLFTFVKLLAKKG